MEDKTIIAIVLAALGIVGAVIKLHHDLVNKIVPGQVDRLVEALVNNNTKADERHAENRVDMRGIKKALRKLKRKKCPGNSFQFGPSRQPEQAKRVKTRPKKRVSKG